MKGRVKLNQRLLLIGPPSFIKTISYFFSNLGCHGFRKELL